VSAEYSLHKRLLLEPFYKFEGLLVCSLLHTSVAPLLSSRKIRIAGI
jgi:hypothetical protein